ncbi:MAG: hypothetical protein ACRDDX_16085 [Cellulosilyticaceae bacterium]
MNQDIHSEEMYEIFEGDLRKLDELIGQLELWSDEYTINHKKEELRLPQYIELHNNLEEQKELMADFLSERIAEEGKSERVVGYQERIEQRLHAYEETEKVIHDWVRAIKDVQVLIMRSEILQNNKDYIESILNEASIEK